MKKICSFLLFFIFIVIPIFNYADQSKKVVLVLGSGGNKGLAHVGVIEELENMGIVPDLIVGCSSGALIGALYAQNQNIEEVKNILIDLKSDDLIDISLFQEKAISTRKKLKKFMREHLVTKDFSSLEIPLIAVVTDLEKGTPVYLEEGELHPALFASSALPGLFPPYKMQDKTYVDGGVSDPLPVLYAKSRGDYIVIASDISSAIEAFKVEDLSSLLSKCLEIMYQRLASFQKEEADILLEMNFDPDLDSPFEDNANQQFYEKGKEVVRNQSENILKLIK